MIDLNDSVKNVLDRIFLEENATQIGKSSKGLYKEMKDKIMGLSSIGGRNANTMNDVPFNWKRDNKNVLVVRNYKFSYEVLSEDYIIVEEVYHNGHIIDESKQ